MGRARWTVAIVVVIAVAGLAGATILRGWTPTVPDDSAIPLVATAALQGAIAPDVTDDVDPDTIPLSPSGQACLETIERPAGPLFLCWAAYKDSHDGDPLKDYYKLRVYGTFGGESGTGVRWVDVRADLVGEPSNNAFDVWPEGVFDGPCQQVDVSLATDPVVPETICGRTTGTTGTTATEGRSHTVTWTCVGCLIPDHADRSVALHEFVAVPAGTIPTWKIFADLGG